MPEKSKTIKAWATIIEGKVDMITLKKEKPNWEHKKLKIKVVPCEIKLLCQKKIKK